MYSVVSYPGKSDEEKLWGSVGMAHLGLVNSAKNVNQGKDFCR